MNEKKRTYEKLGIQFSKSSRKGKRIKTEVYRCLGESNKYHSSGEFGGGRSGNRTDDSSCRQWFVVNVSSQGKRLLARIDSWTVPIVYYVTLEASVKPKWAKWSTLKKMEGGKSIPSWFLWPTTHMSMRVCQPLMTDIMYIYIFFFNKNFAWCWIVKKSKEKGRMKFFKGIF